MGLFFLFFFFVSFYSMDSVMCVPFVQRLASPEENFGRRHADFGFSYAAFASFVCFVLSCLSYFIYKHIYIQL